MSQGIFPVGEEFEFNGRWFKVITAPKPYYCETIRDDGVAVNFIAVDTARQVGVDVDEIARLLGLPAMVKT